MKRCLPLALLALLMAWPGHSSSGSLIRLTEREDLLGWEAVGRVEHSDGYCTGTLVATNLVLTAAHCLFSPSGEARPAEAILFRAGLRDGASIADRKVIRYAVTDGYNPTMGATPENVRHDAALLELESAIPAATANPFVVHERPLEGEPISVVSFGKKRDYALSWQRECNILGEGQGLVAFDCDVTFGSSGAPVFTDGGRRARIVSLVVAGHKIEDGTTVAFGMYLPPVLDALKQKLRSAPSMSQTNNGARFSKPRITIGGNSSRSGNTSGAKFAKP